MKRLLFFTLLYCSFSSTIFAADEFVDGFYTTNSNVTLPCKILIPKDFGHFNEISLFSKVIILDSAGVKKKYKPNEISGYAFVYNDKKYVYVSKQVEEEGTKVFLWPVNLGNKINEYYYYTTTAVNTDKGSTGSAADVYVLEITETKETLTLTRGGTLTDNFKNKMRRFFEYDKKLLTILARDVKNFHDISKFVVDANNENP
jgi:hypothetical protein